MDIKSIFLVGNETYFIDGAGQSAVASAISQFKDQVVKLHGFLIDGQFKPVDLSSHWDRTIIKRNPFAHSKPQNNESV